MKKKIICISVIMVLLIIWFFRVVVVFNRYTQPEIKEIDIGGKFTAHGITYKYESMDMYDFEGIMKEYNLNQDEMLFGSSLNTYEKKYYVIKYTITIEDENYYYDMSDFGYINRYSSGYHHEIPFIYALNGGTEIEMEKGESGTFYMVITLIDYEYTEKTFEELSLDDMIILFYDRETGVEYRMEAK